MEARENQGVREYARALMAAVSRARKALEEAGVDYTLEEGKGFVELVVPVEGLVKAAEAMRQAGFDHVVSLTVVDYLKEKRFRVSYHVTSYLDEEIEGAIVGLAVDLPRGERPVLPSLTGVWLSAEFQEREAYEFFGLEFEGHPDLKPLLLTPPVAEKRPLRKDFVVREENIYEGVPKEWSKK